MDDHLALLVLAGALGEDELGDRAATTSLWYLRLVAAVTAPPQTGVGPGRLSRLLDTAAKGDVDDLRIRILAPPKPVLDVLHPMRFARETAGVQRSSRLNLLAAETLGAARHHGASFLVAAPNAGGPIEAVAEQLGVAIRVLGGP